MNTQAEDPIIEATKTFVMQAHGDQLYGNQPYINHLLHVEQVAIRFGYSTDWRVRTCCLLHDIVEDTTVTIPEVEELYGQDVAVIIDAVTDRDGETKKDVFEDRTRHNGTAVIVKLADRIANVEACLAENKIDILKKYVREMPLFLEVLPAKELEPFMLSYLEELIANTECRIDMGMNYHNGDPYGTND